MAAIDTLQVFQALNSSPNARLVHSAELGDGLSAALWTNHHDAQDYEAPSHHTLSCYIAGGTGTFRRDQPGQKGGPDKLCILPADHESGWVINGDIRLAHLYFSAEQFALGCVTLLDREPREMQLREQTFLEDPQQARRFRQLLTLNWDDFNDLSEVVPLLARIYPNGLADVNQFEQAGGMPYVIGQLLDSGLVHADVLTVAGEGGLERYRQRPRLDGETVVWEHGAAESGDTAIVSISSGEYVFEYPAAPPAASPPAAGTSSGR